MSQPDDPRLNAVYSTMLHTVLSFTTADRRQAIADLCDWYDIAEPDTREIVNRLLWLLSSWTLVQLRAHCASEPAVPTTPTTGDDE
jgi:hypothetical protein